jgi:hypothetical protein
MTFQGRCKKSPEGEVQNDLRGGAYCTSPQNPAMLSDSKMVTAMNHKIAV